jgi:diguanylate cyclase (GGDEF)-like protein
MDMNMDDMDKETTMEDTLVFRKRLERARRSSACLVVIAGSPIGEKISLIQQRMVIGRQPNVEIPIADSMISRKHAELVVQPDQQVMIRDLGSTNGTYINENRTIQAVLKDGELVRIGSTVFKYVGPGSIEHLYLTILSDRARLDGLTAIFNKQVFHDCLSREFQRCRDLREPLTLIIMDLDLFKQVNDRMGHPAGDYVLQEVASLLKGTFRRTDLFARYGGEEFGVLLPHTNLQEACIVAERIRNTIEKHPFNFKGQSLILTTSIGVAELTDDLKDADELLSRADSALYEAKQSGRNRVCTHQS